MPRKKAGPVRGIEATITIATDREPDLYARAVHATNERGAQIRREREHVRLRVSQLVQELRTTRYTNEGSPPGTPPIDTMLIADALCNAGQQLREDYERAKRMNRGKGTR